MKAFVIYLPERPHSVSHATNMVETLNSYHIDAQLFEGTNGNEGVQLAKKAKKILYPYSIKSIVLSEE